MTQMGVMVAWHDLNRTILSSSIRASSGRFGCWLDSKLLLKPG